MSLVGTDVLKCLSLAVTSQGSSNRLIFRTLQVVVGAIHPDLVGDRLECQALSARKDTPNKIWEWLPLVVGTFRCSTGGWWRW